MQPDSKGEVLEKYSEEQKAACEAWNVEILLDIFPQADKFETSDYPPLWAMSKPVVFDEIGNKLDEISQSQLVACVTASESDFDATYDKMLKELEDSGMNEAKAMLTEIIKDKIAVSN